MHGVLNMQPCIKIAWDVYVPADLTKHVEMQQTLGVFRKNPDCMGVQPHPVNISETYRSTSRGVEVEMYGG